MDTTTEQVCVYNKDFFNKHTNKVVTIKLKRGFCILNISDIRSIVCKDYDDGKKTDLCITGMKDETLFSCTGSNVPIMKLYDHLITIIESGLTKCD